MEDGVYSSVEESRGVFGVSCVGSGGGGDETSLVDVEWDDNAWGIVDTSEEKGGTYSRRDWTYVQEGVGTLCRI